MLTYEQFLAHPDQANHPEKSEARLRQEFAAYQARNTPGYGGRGLSNVGGEQLYTGGQDVTGQRALAAQQGRSEDLLRFDEASVGSWEGAKDSGCPPNAPYRSNEDGSCVEKPIDSGGYTMPGGAPGPGQNRGAGGGGGGNLGSIARGGAGGAPQFSYGQFVPPSYEEAMAEPGYQAALHQGEDTLTRQASALGTLRTGGTLKDLIDYGQNMGAQQYQNVYNRAAQTHGINYQTAQDVFAPQYGAWQTQYGGDLSKWQTQYGGDLSKYLQREQNIYGLLNQPAPAYPGGF